MGFVEQGETGGDRWCLLDGKRKKLREMRLLFLLAHRNTTTTGLFKTEDEGVVRKSRKKGAGQKSRKKGKNNFFSSFDFILVESNVFLVGSFYWKWRRMILMRLWFFMVAGRHNFKNQVFLLEIRCSKKRIWIGFVSFDWIH